MITQITLKGLPKISLNKFYSGMHWSKRNALKDEFHWLIRSQVDKKFTEPCKVRYNFYFTQRALDCSNAAGGMVKLIEDVLFEDDSPKVVKEISISSRLGTENKVIITVIPENN